MSFEKRAYKLVLRNSNEIPKHFSAGENVFTIESETGVNLSFRFDKVSKITVGGETENESPRSNCTYVVQGPNSDFVKERFTTKALQLLTNPFFSSDDGWILEMKCICSWGVIDAFKDAQIAVPKILNRVRRSDTCGERDIQLREQLDAALNLSCVERAGVLLSLKRYSDNHDWNSAVHCLMLPSWRKANRKFRQQIEDFYGSDNSDTIFSWCVRTSSDSREVLIETVVDARKDSLKEVVQWCKLGARPSQSSLRRKEACRVSGNETISEVDSGAIGDPEPKNFKAVLMKEVAELRKEIAMLKKEKATITASVTALLDEMTNARRLLRSREDELIHKAQNARLLLYSAHSSASAEHRTILTQIASAVDAFKGVTD